MWLVVSLIAAIIVTIFWFEAPKKFKLGSLALMLWGLSVMIFVDHILGYEGGAFLEMETDGLISSGVVLGIAMLIPIFIVWEVAIVLSKLKNEKVEPIKG